MMPDDLNPGGIVVRDEAEQPQTGGWRTGAQAPGRPREVRELPPLLALLPRLRDRRSTARRSPASTSATARAASSAPRSARRARSRWSRTNGAELSELQVLTGGEAAAHAMRQIDPDVVPVYPITPQTPIIQGFAKFVAERHGDRRDRQRRVGALGDERRGRRRARRRAHDDRDVVAGDGADGRDRLHRRRDARADRDGGRQPRALGRRSTSTATTPTRCSCATPARSSSSPRTRRRRTTSWSWRRASRSTPTCCSRCSSARTASRSRTPPSRSRCSTTTTCRRFVGEYAIPFPLLDLAPADDAGPVRDARLLLRAARTQLGRAWRRALPVIDEVADEFARPERPAARRARGATGSRTRSARSSSWARPPAPRRTSSTSCAPRASRSGCSRSARSGRFPAREVRDALADAAATSRCSTAPTRRAAPPPLFAEVAAALYGSGVRPAQLRLRPRRPRPPPGGHARGLRARRSACPEELRRTEERG